MKKLLLLISFLFFAVISFCQFPISQSQGSSVTQVYSKGGLGNDSGAIWRTSYIDTSAANHGFLKLIPGIVIRVADTLFMRNNATNKWMNIGSGGSSATTWDQVMTNNPDLQSNYVSSFTNHTWDLQRIADFAIHSDGGATTRLKINAGSSSMFAPNGSDGIILTNNNITLKNIPTYISRVDSIGQVINYSWGTNPLTTWSVSGTAVTTDGVKTRINGTTTLTYPTLTGVEDHHTLQTIIVNSRTGTQVFSIEFVPTWQNATFTRKATFVLTQDSCYINYYSNDGATIPDTSNKSLYTFSVNLGDTLDLGFYYSKGNISPCMTSRRTGQQSLLTYKAASVANIANIKILATGDFSLLNNYQYFIDEPLSPDYSATGNSITIGSGASSIMYRWMNQTFQGYSNLYVIHGSSFERSTEALLRIQELCHVIKPHYGFWGDGVNDPGSSILPPAYASNVVAWVDSLIANNIVPILISCSPQVTNMTPYNDSLRAIATRFGLQYIDVFTLLVDPAGGTNRNPKYNSDGVHFNDAGYKVWSGAVQKTITSNLKVAPTLVIPHINLVPEPAMKYIIGLDYNNQLVASVSGLNNGYIENILSTSVTTNGQQTASISIGGRFVHFGSGIAGLTDFIVVGQGNLAVPNFKVQAGVVTAQTFVASTISSANFSTTGTLSLFNAGTILEANGVFYRNTSTNGYLFKLVNASTTGFIIDEEVAQGPNMIIQQWNRFGTKVALVNRGGGAEFDSTVILPNIFARVPDTTTYKPMVVDGSGNVFKSNWAYAGTGGGGTGTDNTNLGSFFRWVVPSSQGIKGAAPGLDILIDSTSNANSLTFKADTATMFPQIRATITGTGVTTMGAFGSTPNANGGSISGVTLTLQPADGTNPGGISTTTQTIPGAKTFAADVTIADTKVLKVNATQVLYLPNQTSFPSTLVLGTTGASFAAGNTFNTIVGLGTATALTSGTTSFYGGTRTGTAVTTGTGHVAIGDAVMTAVTNGVSNTAIGAAAMQTTGTGVSNSVAVGASALKKTTANGNVAVGLQSQQEGTSGLHNTSVGLQSLLFNQTGSENSAFGDLSLFGVSVNSVTGNAAFGYKALTAATTAKACIAIGDSAGYTTTSAIREITIGSNTTGLGNYSANFQNLWYGTGMTGTATTPAGNMGIGVTAPSARLMLPAGTTAASSSPFKFTSGTNMTAVEAGAMEYDGTQLFFSPGATRNILAQVSGSTAITSTLIPFATTSGYLTSSSNLNFSTGLGVGSTGSNAFAIVMGGSGYTSGVMGMVGASVSPTAGSSSALGFFGGTIVEAASGTHTYLASVNIDAPTITGGVATVTNTATLRISGAPSATVTGSNSPLWIVSGVSRFGTAGTSLGSFTLEGNTSGVVTVQPQAAAGTYNFNLPTTAGTSGQFLTSGGGSSSPMTWTTSATVKSGSFSGVGTATTTFTVTFGGTQADANYQVNVTPTAALSAALFYVTNKTTTTFDVVYLAGLTGTVTFDWSLFR